VVTDRTGPKILLQDQKRGYFLRKQYIIGYSLEGPVVPEKSKELRLGYFQMGGASATTSITYKTLI